MSRMFRFLPKSAPQLPSWSTAWTSYGGEPTPSLNFRCPFSSWTVISFLMHSSHVTKFVAGPRRGGPSGDHPMDPHGGRNGRCPVPPVPPLICSVRAGATLLRRTCETGQGAAVLRLLDKTFWTCNAHENRNAEKTSNAWSIFRGRARPVNKTSSQHPARDCAEDTHQQVKTT